VPQEFMGKQEFTAKQEFISVTGARENNLDVIAHPDHVVDLGPDGGDASGSIVFPGTPAELLTAGTHTGEHLVRHVGATMSR
jgi:excinuclease UvrABC ATPase subunit